MMIRRTLPPTAAPIYCRDILNGLKGAVRGEREVDRFEGELRDYFGVQHCFTLSSGRAALAVILRALQTLRPERSIVVIPAYTCYSVAASVVRAGLSLRLCDVDARTLDFNYTELQNIIARDSKEILSIIPVHLFGLPADMYRLKEITSGHDIFIVEDAAQAFGGKDSKGNTLGTNGDVGFFSLGRGKPITAAGGGVVITNRDDVASSIENHVEGVRSSSLAGLVQLIFQTLALALFVRPKVYWFPRQLPFLKIGETIYDEKFAIRRLTPFQAGLTKGWQYKIERLKEVRRLKARRFLTLSRNNAFHGYVSEEDDLPDLLRFPLLSRQVDLEDDSEHSNALEILGVVPYYPTSIQRIEELKDLFTGEQYPGADWVAAHLLTLPIHFFVLKDDSNKIIDLMERRS